MTIQQRAEQLKSDFYIDGEKVDMSVLIKRAKACGYESDGFYQTSIAARILRENGYRVTDTPDKAQP